MQKKQSRTNLSSWDICERNGWFIKLSIEANENILLIFISKHTGQTLVRYFTNENDAVEYINYVIESNPDLTR